MDMRKEFEEWYGGPCDGLCHEENAAWSGWQAALSHIGGGSKAEPVAIVEEGPDDSDCNTAGLLLSGLDLPVGTELFAHPAPTAQDSEHWAVKNPGRADQYRQEAMAARACLGFASDADDVSPSDIRREINALTTQDSKVPEGWSVDEVGDAMHVYAPDGKWCGFMPINGPAHAMMYKFLKALAAPVPVPDKPQRRPMCRDCADAAGICPNDGTPCDSAGLQRPSAPEGE